MNYLQSSLNFSSFIRSEIGKFGVGQAAVDMAFQTSLKFPEMFILDRIYGEEPLYIYTIDLSGVLTQSEATSDVVQKDYQLERDELRDRLISYNMSEADIKVMFDSIEANGRRISISDFIKSIKHAGVSSENMVIFMKNFSIDDLMITRILSSV